MAPMAATVMLLTVAFICVVALAVVYFARQAVRKRHAAGLPALPTQEELDALSNGLGHGGPPFG